MYPFEPPVYVIRCWQPTWQQRRDQETNRNGKIADDLSLKDHERYRNPAGDKENLFTMFNDHTRCKTASGVRLINLNVQVHNINRALLDPERTMKNGDQLRVKTKCHFPTDCLIN